MVVDTIQENPIAASQALLSFALVIATAIYTYYTKAQTDEMEATREMENQPILRGNVLTSAPTLMVAEIRNTGNGAAHDVTITISIEDIDAEPVEFTTPILSPGEDFRFPIPVNETDSMVLKMGAVQSKLDEKDSDGILTFRFDCESPFGKEYTYKNEVDLYAWLENKGALVNYEEEVKMRKALEDIESNLEDIERTMKSNNSSTPW
ncbi:hypothetical protein JMJ58_03740 [Haloterrigena salifodinae]|uniref:CARDB domain-containing protein n=1 Tax=Haloterrigena salifodinae TaxID=2675099 RepID=A0A8T8E3P4_9EURY|nr:hypothetical protein [Haloterrigena salifodinae]QRV16021.1 hypothetical protein JMJ58_03740 [Haloterrigena salifodinae]